MTSGLAALEDRVAKDLALVAYPERDWVPPRIGPDGAGLLDVLIVGAGQGGLVTAFRLLRERVGNILLIDARPEGEEGVWGDYARMVTLRSWKTVTGPDLDIPSLTFQAWFEAQWGEAAFAALGKIPKEMWAAYLLWYRRLLKLPVRNGARLERIEGASDHLVAHLAGGELLRARKLVLATGIDGTGRWWMPPAVERLPAHLRAHTADRIDFAALRGKRVGVLGAAASAFDNASTALEAGAASVDLFSRRTELQRVQPFKQMSYAGFFRHLADLDDAWRWRVMRHLLNLREAFPKETWERATKHRNFRLHLGAPWLDVGTEAGGVRVSTPQGGHRFDYVIAGTGLDIDLVSKPALRDLAPLVALWADRYTPPEGEADERLSRYPYLGPALDLTEKRPGAAPYLSRIHLFTYAATMSAGPSGASINAMKFAAPRLVAGITRDLFREDIAIHHRNLLAYATPEFDFDERD